MSRTRRLIALALAAALATPVLAAPASATPQGYYSVPYADTLYFHQHGGDVRTNFAFAVDYQRWWRDGLPTPRPAPTSYVRYPWSATVLAVQFWESERETWTWEALTPEAWARAGRPAPSTAGWISSSIYERYASSDEIIVSTSWDRVRHRLTPAEWAAAGSPAPYVQSNVGFYKYPWSPSIGFMTDISTGYGFPIDHAEWTRLGSPTPQVVDHVPYESVWRYRESNKIFLDSSLTGRNTLLTFDQWVALGKPTPRIVD